MPHLYVFQSIPFSTAPLKWQSAFASKHTIWRAQFYTMKKVNTIKTQIMLLVSIFKPWSVIYIEKRLDFLYGCDILLFGLVLASSLSLISQCCPLSFHVLAALASFWVPSCSSSSFYFFLDCKCNISLYLFPPTHSRKKKQSLLLQVLISMFDFI